MGRNRKGDDPWDDSALVEAFDRAFSTYKGMHGIKNVATTSNTEGLTDAERIMSTSTENTEESEVHTISDTTPEDFCISHADSDAHGELPHAEESQPCEKSSHPEQISGDSIYENAGGYDPTGYYQLLHQYYAIEEQRIKVLQQLCLASYWNYQMPFQSSTYQANQAGYCNGLDGGSLASGQLCNEYLASGSSGYYGSCAPWNSVGAAPQPALNGGRKVLGNVEDSSVRAGNTEAALKTAVVEAERLISTLKIEASSGSITCESGMERNGTQCINASSLAQHDGSETDLAQVLGAWYTAGFYTGRYTLEQSLKRNHE